MEKKKDKNKQSRLDNVNKVEGERFRLEWNPPGHGVSLVQNNAIIGLDPFSLIPHSQC